MHQNSCPTETQLPNNARQIDSKKELMAIFEEEQLKKLKKMRMNEPILCLLHFFIIT